LGVPIDCITRDRDRIAGELTLRRRAAAPPRGGGLRGRCAIEKNQATDEKKLVFFYVRRDAAAPPRGGGLWGRCAIEKNQATDEKKLVFLTYEGVILIFFTYRGF
jgi:hypothetical protein